jgi:hypothetical protein
MCHTSFFCFRIPKLKEVEEINILCFQSRIGSMHVFVSFVACENVMKKMENTGGKMKTPAWLDHY